MGRWEPDAAAGWSRPRSALRRAGVREHHGRGDRRARPGLTERTFFRHFADKREVLFAGAGALQELLVHGRRAPSAAPIERRRGIEAAGALFRGSPRGARQRQAVIAANAELQERELIKLATLARRRRALRLRGVSDPAASLAAEAGSPCSNRVRALGRRRPRSNRA